MGAELVRSGSVGVIPTDTLYGLVCRYDDPESVERIYRLKRRDRSKPCIVLIDEIERLAEFGVLLDRDELKAVKGLWPGPVSVIFTVQGSFDALTCGTGTLAFRVPSDESLRSFLSVSGPILAPSANMEGMGPSKTVSEAYVYFGDDIDFYVEDGKREGPASRIVKITESKEVVYRL